MRKQLFSVLALSLSFAAFTAAQDAAQQAAQAAQQALSIAPNLPRSHVAVAQYTFPGQPVATAPPAAPVPTPARDPSGKYILTADTPVHLIFSGDVNERTVEIGDKVPLVLAEDFA